MFDIRTSVLFAALLAGAAVQTASATSAVIDFDDLPTGFTFPGVGSLPSVHEGFRFSCVQSSLCVPINVFTYGGNPSGYPGAVVSGTNVFSSASPLTMRRDDGGTFSFDSAYFTSAWRNGLVVDVAGFNGPTQIASTSFVLASTGVASLRTFGWGGLTSLVISTSGGTPNPGFAASIPSVAIDDFAYQVGTVPEPATYALWLGGLCLVGALRRRSVRACR